MNFLELAHILGHLKSLKRTGWSVHKKIALLHDLGEALIGDIVTERGSEVLEGRKQKLQDERRAVKQIATKTEMPELIELYDEFRDGSSPEAQLVFELDKLETAIQASEFARKFDIDLNEFRRHAEARIKDRELRTILDNLKL